MTTPYVGEIRMFGFSRTPTGWLACDGSVLPISQYETLYTLIGTAYGGDGQSTFALPDLRGRVPIHQGTGRNLTPRTLGQIGGTEQVVLTSGQIPSHSHIVLASTQAATTGTPASTVALASGASTDQIYYPAQTGERRSPCPSTAANSRVAGLGMRIVHRP
jgi:microcystin-dependent protein